MSDSAQRVADRIARAVRAGRPADRTPTVEQLLRAFGEEDATPEARDRVARALALAGVSVSPPVADAPAGSRVALDARAQRRAGWWPLALAGALLALALGAAIALAARGGTEVKTRTMAAPPPRTVTLPPTTVTVAAPAPKPKRAKHRRKRHRRTATNVTVRVVPAGATFLCVEDGHGKRLFDGNLAAPRSFRARVVKLNVGLASTRVLANGKPVRLAGSPTGVRVTRKGSAYLPLGARPCA